MGYQTDPEYGVIDGTGLQMPLDQHHTVIGTEHESGSTVRKSVAANLLLFLLYFLYSRTPDLIGVYIPGTVKVLSAILLLAVLFGGGLKRAFSTSAVKWLSAFTFWLILSTPFSFWKGGSVQLLINDWSKAFLLTIATAGLILTPQYARKALIAVGLGTFQLAVLSVALGGSGRLQFAEGLAGNPNDLALYLVMGIPGCLLLASTSLGFKRVFGWLGVIVLTITALKTGSRMGLIILSVLFVVLFLRQSMAGKIKLALALIILGSIGWTLAPQSAKDRYRTLWTDEDSPDASQEARKAMGSTEARQNLIQLGLRVSMQHPLLGVGPGQFGNYLGGEDKEARAKRLAFRETHNTYLQVSSEGGIPAFIFYVGAILVTLFGCFRLAKSLALSPGANSLSATAWFLFLATVVYSCGIFFGSYGYSFFFPVIAGIAAGFRKTALEQELISNRKEEAPIPQ